MGLIEAIKKTIKDDEEKVKSHELNNLRLSSRLSSEEIKTFLNYILHSDILDHFWFAHMIFGILIVILWNDN